MRCYLKYVTRVSTVRLRGDSNGVKLQEKWTKGALLHVMNIRFFEVQDIRFSVQMGAFPSLPRQG